ncbi:hypothetical protein [Novacetimonas hansenii]|uniref:hypothetical protein n=1 Tax=Novacetimonas hansenii TaxID=436 RepID=UPI0006623B0F|nr:hypothetical protein [Novacetimonas hansenii]
MAHLTARRGAWQYRFCRARNICVRGIDESNGHPPNAGFFNKSGVCDDLREKIRQTTLNVHHARAGIDTLYPVRATYDIIS